MEIYAQDKTMDIRANGTESELELFVDKLRDAGIRINSVSKLYENRDRPGERRLKGQDAAQTYRVYINCELPWINS